jgi:DNA-binding GntR family transcriptional regulator
MKDGIVPTANTILPLRDIVFNTLRQAILTGELKPGERLPEVHLAKRLGVSRTPIREAIHKLELEGLVIMVANHGAQVAQLDEKSLHDVMEVRRALDALSVELACERICTEELEALSQACDAFDNAILSEDIKKIAQADVAFHDIIIRAAGNKRLTQIVNNLSEQMYRYRYEHIKDRKQHARLAGEHRLIYESIVRKDKSTAANEAKSHIDNQENVIMEQIRLDAQYKAKSLWV